MLFKKSASEAGNARAVELQSKASLLEQQRILRERSDLASSIAESKTVVSDTLPVGWKTVIDKTTGKPYYWNKVTNMTSWTRPQLESSVLAVAVPTAASSGLPDGWTQLIHPATNQVYYKHSGGKTSFSRPQEGGEAKSGNISMVPEPVRL